jgi:exonuclease SbcC
MRIERIELQNWMSYPRRWVPPDGQNGGEEVVPTIDLSVQPLTLIAGDNGAGKSAILEAICYALFAKYPRGNNQDAIRSKETTAKIRMYFTLPGGKGDVTYCVERLLSKKASKITATLKQVQEDGPDLLLLTGQLEVTNYIKETLLRGVKYDAFVSTVFLRQEEAGKFMGLTHADQREQLLRLCRLEIYKQIYDRAQKHRKGLENQVADLQEQFGGVRYATEGHLSDRRKYAQELQGRRDELRAEEETAKQLLGKVKRAATLAGEIGEREKKLAQWSDSLSRAEEIRHAGQWRIAWERIEGPLTQSRNLHESLARRACDIEQAESNLETSKEDVDRLAEVYGNLRADYQQSAKALNRVMDVLPELVRTNNDAKRALEAAKEARRLDVEIVQSKKEQDARRSQLARFDEVRFRSDYSDLLKQAQNTLQYVLERQDNAETEQQRVEDKGIEAEQARKKSSTLQRSVEEKRIELEELEKEGEDLREKQNKLQRRLDSTRDIIRNRNRAIEAGMCPTCGTDMKGDIGEHVCREIEEHEAQIAVWDEQLKELKCELELVQSRITKLENEVAALEARTKKLENQAELAEAAVRTAEENARINRQQAREQWQQHLALWREIPPPDWLKTPSVETQEEIRKELDELAGIDAEYQRLTEVQARFRTEAEVLQRDRQRRAELAIESPVTDEELARLETAFRGSEEKLNSEQKERDELAQKLKSLERQRDEAEKELKSAQRHLDEIDKDLRNLKTSQGKEQQYLAGIKETLQGEQKQLESRFADLAGGLLTAIESSEMYKGLESRASLYAKEAGFLIELEHAEAESTKVQTEIEVKQEELDSLLEETGSLSEAEASRRVGELQISVNSAEQELNEANREIGNIERDHEQRQSVELRLEEAKSDLWAYRTIEDAIYPGTKTRRAGELFASITQKLMESTSQEASRVLEGLGWHIGISYDEKEGFCITDQALSAVRKYIEFSGGERFAIAIAVALAIGRVTHGAGNIRCLFIDEGFGALDQGHRKRIINDAIGKLIEIGSRDQVVVITHLKDMQSHFPNRVELKREGDRSALVSPIEEVLE